MRMRPPEGRLVGFMSRVWALSVSRVRTRDSGLAYSVRSRGGWKRSRTTVREAGAAGVKAMAAREVTMSRTAAMTAPRRAARPRSPVERALVVPEVVEKELRSRASMTWLRRCRREPQVHRARMPTMNRMPSAVGRTAS